MTYNRQIMCCRLNNFSIDQENMLKEQDRIIKEQNRIINEYLNNQRSKNIYMNIKKQDNNNNLNEE